MSKFTKALDKIQTERKPEQKIAAGKVTLPAGEKISEEGPRWDRGIPSIKHTEPDNRLVTLRFPDSMISEQYRMLRTSLKNRLQQEKARVILISSAIHSEGKTVTASNLALALAEDAGVRVAVVDADLRRGKLAQYFGFKTKRKGLSEFLSEELALQDVMVRNSVQNLVVIPRGTATRKPSELVGSVKLKNMIQELKTLFDYVIIDAPPIMSVADAGILARDADGVLFILQVGRTPKSMIAHSHQLFKEAGAKVLGYVLTNVEYYSSEYRYYNNYYYDDREDRETMRGKTKDGLKRAGLGLRTWEDKFNRWWDKKILKK